MYYIIVPAVLAIDVGAWGKLEGGTGTSQTTKPLS